MSERRIDAEWIAANPLPRVEDGLDKDARGRVLVVGGSAFVPGAPRLTGEAALRSGAGKVQVATIDAAALALGMAFPECAVIGLPVDDEGEIAAQAEAVLADYVKRCDTLVIGPGMRERPQTARLVEALVGAVTGSVLLDAGAMTALRGNPDLAARHAAPFVLTPHHGELARMLDCERDGIAQDPARAAREAAARFGSVVAVKSKETVIAEPGGDLLVYASEAPGLGTAGSGDVLAGIIAGLLARGMAPVAAVGWGVLLHGEAGHAAARRSGTMGFLARELSGHVPELLEEGSEG